jgi:hypothetical protein
VGTGPNYTFQLVELVDSDLRRMSGLVHQYADLWLGGTDASVVAICERLGIVTVATVNLRDFATVRSRHVPAFITVPDSTNPSAQFGGRGLFAPRQWANSKSAAGSA